MLRVQSIDLTEPLEVEVVDLRKADIEDSNFPTYMDPEAALAIVESLNNLLANTYALLIKTKNFHWHMTGSNFRDYHLMLDEQATQIYGMTDDVAERARKLGGTTIHSIGEIDGRKTIEDSNDDGVPVPEMLNELMRDNQTLVENLRSTHDLCDENDDRATTAMIEVWLDETEKRIWFLYEASNKESGLGQP